MPCWMYSFPSGRNVIRPSKPSVPPEKFPTATPTPVTMLPRRWPFRWIRSAQLNRSAPMSRASRIRALERNDRAPVNLGAPHSSPVFAALIFRIST